MNRILTSVLNAYNEEKRAARKQQFTIVRIEDTTIDMTPGYMEPLHITYETASRPKVHFLTFSNTEYMKPLRILRDALSFQFSTIHSMNEYSIPEYIEKHKAFIENNVRGYGLWIWKPKIIYDKLSSVNDGEIVVYCDAGMHLNVGGLQRYHEYIEMMKRCDILTFSLNDEYKAQHYVKHDVINAYYPEFANQLTPYCYAGVIIFKKTESTMKVVKDWLELCENYNFIDGSPSSVPELDIFRGNDCDNGLFNICIAKHGISKAIYPDETNIYGPNKMQIINTPGQDWSSLDKYPFQCRRLRPRKQ